MKPVYGPRIAVLLAISFAMTGCGSQPLPYMRSGAALKALARTGAGKITHVVFIVQENRSFDDLFQGYPGANTVPAGMNSKGQLVNLQPWSMKKQFIIDHSSTAMITACHGRGKLPGTKCRNDWFDKESAFGGPQNNPEYIYVPHKESKPYFDMAHEWVLGDNMFQSQLDESFIAHQYIIAAQAASAVNLPYGQWGCSGGTYDKIDTLTASRTFGSPETACFDYQTLGDELDKAGLSWRFYASSYGSISSDFGAVWSSYQAVKHIYYGPDWKKDVITPNWKFITDVRAGYLANFTWVVPVCNDSDHINCPGGYGPSWVTALVNTVGKSKFWDSTAIFVIWDDWGGSYDHVPPPFEDYDGLGFRIPILVISPYAKQNYVSHAQYETASVLRFAEDLFGLGQLAAADKRANSPALDCFDFSQAPRTFVKIHAPVPPRFFMDQFHENYFAPDYE
jgi:phospholipase C